MLSNLSGMKIRIVDYLDEYRIVLPKIRSKKKRHIKKLHSKARYVHTETYYELYGELHMGPVSFMKLKEKLQ